MPIAHRHRKQQQQQTIIIIIMQLYICTINIHYARARGKMHDRCNPQCCVVVVIRRCLQLLSITYLRSPGADGLRYIAGQVALCVVNLRR